MNVGVGVHYIQASTAGPNVVTVSGLCGCGQSPCAWLELLTDLGTIQEPESAQKRESSAQKAGSVVRHEDKSAKNGPNRGSGSGKGARERAKSPDERAGENLPESGEWAQ